MTRDELEQAVILREELANRRTTDPWFQWEPKPRQRPFVEAVLTRQVSEVWFIAANRSGKSDAAAYIGSALARFGRTPPKWGYGGQDAKPTRGWVISASTTASRDVIQPKFFDNGMAAAENHAPFIPQRELASSFNINEQTLKLKNGSIIEFKTAEAKVLTFAGGGIDWVLIDEECPKPLYDELVIRVSGGRRLLVIGACTLLPPEGQVGGVSWIFPEKIKPWLANPRGVDFEIYGSSIYDNDSILPSEIARLEARYPVGSPERAIRLDGAYLPGMQGARAYPSFDARIHVKPQEPPEPRRPICWIWDFNVEPMISLIGQRRDHVFHIWRELVLDEGDLDRMVQYFAEAVPGHAAEIWVYGDATGRNRHAAAPGGRSEYQIISNAMRTYGCPMRLKVAEVNPLVTDRINAVNRAFRDEEGVARVEIDPSCTELIEDFEQVLRDNKGGIKKTRNRKDPYFRRTHTSDAFGYWIAYEEPVRSTTIGQKLIAAIRNPGYAFGRK